MAWRSFKGSIFLRDAYAALQPRGKIVIAGSGFAIARNLTVMECLTQPLDKMGCKPDLMGIHMPVL